jgi:integrase
VRQAVHRSRGQRGIGPLKTKAARRNIAVPCSVVKEVADFLRDNSAAADGRIFTAKRDYGYLTDVRLNAAVHEAARRAGIRGGAVHFHELRHTYASLLVDAGANIKALQYAMGHTDSRTTTDLYIHLYPDADRALADALEARLEENLNGSAA